MRIIRRISGGGLLLSLFLPWVMLSVNACGMHQSTQFSGVELVTGTNHLYQQASQMLGAQTPAALLHYLTWIAVAIVFVGVGGIAGLAGSSGAFPLAAAGVGLFAYVSSRLQAALGSTAGLLSMTYRAGFYLALLSTAALLAAYAGSAESSPRQSPSPWSEAAAAKDRDEGENRNAPRTCRRCDAPLTPTNRFCARCGAPVRPN